MKNILLSIFTLTIFVGCSSSSINPNQTEINGYTVPVMPDQELNNATLLGVDTDNNGIRDDIDRHIAETYPEPVEHAVAELRAKAFLDKFKDPENAYEKKLYVSSHSFIYCKSYIKHFYGKEVLNSFKFQDLDKNIVNTAQREKAKWIYNASLSGHAFTSFSTHTEKDCPAEINNILKDYKKIK